MSCPGSFPDTTRFKNTNCDPYTKEKRVCKQTHHAKCYQVLCCDSNTLRLLPGPLLRRRAIRCKEVYHLYCCVLYVVASCSSKTAGSKQRQGLHCRKHLRPRAASGGNNRRVKQHDTSTRQQQHQQKRPSRTAEHIHAAVKQDCYLPGNTTARRQCYNVRGAIMNGALLTRVQTRRNRRTEVPPPIVG